MKRCAMCHNTTLEPIQRDVSIRVGERLFSARLPALRCTECSATYTAGPDGEHFELLVAAELVKAGSSTGDSFKFIRKVLGFRAKDLAELFDVAPETISRWETGKMPIEHRTMALLGAMVLEQVQGCTGTLEALRALKEPRSLGLKIVLTIDTAA